MKNFELGVDRILVRDLDLPVLVISFFALSFIVYFLQPRLKEWLSPSINAIALKLSNSGLVRKDGLIFRLPKTLSLFEITFDTVGVRPDLRDFLITLKASSFALLTRLICSPCMLRFFCFETLSTVVDSCPRGMYLAVCGLFFWEWVDLCRTKTELVTPVAICVIESALVWDAKFRLFFDAFVGSPISTKLS